MCASGDMASGSEVLQVLLCSLGLAYFLRPAAFLDLAGVDTVTAWTAYLYAYKYLRWIRVEWCCRMVRRIRRVAEIASLEDVEVSDTEDDVVSDSIDPVVIIAEDVSPTTTIETILECEVSDAEDDEVRDNAEPDSCPWDVSPTTSIETILESAVSDSTEPESPGGRPRWTARRKSADLGGQRDL